MQVPVIAMSHSDHNVTCIQIFESAEKCVLLRSWSASSTTLVTPLDSYRWLIAFTSAHIFRLPVLFSQSTHLSGSVAAALRSKD